MMLMYRFSGVDPGQIRGDAGTTARRVSGDIRGCSGDEGSSISGPDSFYETPGIFPLWGFSGSDPLRGISGV